MKFCRFVPQERPDSAPAPLYGIWMNIRYAKFPARHGWSGHSRARLAARIRTPCRAGRNPARSCVSVATMPRMRRTRQRNTQRAADVLKPPSSIVGPGEPNQPYSVFSTRRTRRELAIVIAALFASRDSDDALSFVLGYTCLNDVTARDIQKSDVQFTRGKGFDTFCPIGPHIEPISIQPMFLSRREVNGDGPASAILR